MSKTALITGATSGLGAAYAKKFASEGYDLIITGRRKEKIEANANEIIEKYKVTVEVIMVELSNKEGVDKLLEHIKNRTIDAIVNNAGYGMKPYFLDADMIEIEKMIYLQSNAVVRLTQEVLKGMKEKNSGIIINISSDSAYLLMPKNVMYSATKIFIRHFTEGLHIELLDTDIKVQVVCPGFIQSDFHESAGMNTNKKKMPWIMHFMEPTDVVNLAFKDLNKGKAISIPGFHNKLLISLLSMIPKKQYYKFANNFVKKKFSKKASNII